MCVCVFIITWVGHMLHNFRHFDDVLLNLHLDLENCFASTSFLSSSFIVFYLSSDTRRRPSVESACVFHFLYVSSYRWLHFSGAVLLHCPCWLPNSDTCWLWSQHQTQMVRHKMAVLTAMFYQLSNVAFHQTKLYMDRKTVNLSFHSCWKGPQCFWAWVPFKP